eukprot:gene813-9063_t
MSNDKETKIETKKEIKIEEKKQTVPLELAILTEEEGLQTFLFYENEKKLELKSETKVDKPDVIQYSPDGNSIVLVFKEKIQIYKNTNENKLECVLEIFEKGVEMIQFSPLSTYLVTIRDFIEEKDEKEGEGNLIVWKLSDGTAVFKNQVKFVSDKWPLLQWNDNESKCGIVINKALHIYDNEMKFESKIKSGSVLFFQLSPASSFAICTRSNQSSLIVNLHKFNTFKAVGTCLIPDCDKVEIMWNKQGTVALIFCSMDVDKNFYGGRSQLFYSKINEIGKPFISNKDNTYDVKWNPQGTEFIVVHGYPQQATLFDENLKELGTFTSGKMNRSFWNPFGKLFLLGGLEGMNGDIEVVDRKKKKKIGGMNAKRGCRIMWSNDGRLILGRTVQSVLKVDNGFQIYKYNGMVLFEKEFPVLLFASWKPTVDKNEFVYNPPSPRGLKQSKSVEKKIEKVETAYVPPHLRNKEPETKGKSSPNKNKAVAKYEKSTEKLELKIGREVLEFLKNNAETLGIQSNKQLPKPMTQKKTIKSIILNTKDSIEKSMSEDIENFFSFQLSEYVFQPEIEIRKYSVPLILSVKSSNKTNGLGNSGISPPKENKIKIFVEKAFSRIQLRRNSKGNEKTDPSTPQTSEKVLTLIESKNTKIENQHGIVPTDIPYLSEGTTKKKQSFNKEHFYDFITDCTETEYSNNHSFSCSFYESEADSDEEKECDHPDIVEMMRNIHS